MTPVVLDSRLAWSIPSTFHDIILKYLSFPPSTANEPDETEAVAEILLENTAESLELSFRLLSSSLFLFLLMRAGLLVRAFDEPRLKEQNKFLVIRSFFIDY